MARMTRQAPSRTASSSSARAWNISPEERQRIIGERAYYRFAERGYAPGHDLDDWLAAEADFERLGRRRQPRGPETIQELGMQHGSTFGPAEDDALKRVINEHPRREIPRMESMEPEDAPRKQ